jgi:hypothetical protein
VASQASKLGPTAWVAVDAQVHAASTLQMDLAFARIAPYLAGDRWLGPRHPMRNVRSGLKGKTLPFDLATSNKLAENLAVSVPLHVADALSYFGRGMAALSAGSVEIAQHLFYYSELRATHALLARHGITTLDRKNFVLDSGGIAREVPIADKRISLNSHQSLWVLFAAWTRDPRTAVFCGDQLRVGGSTLNQWVAGRAVATPLSAVFAPLLESWGMDLERFGADRDFRNHMSYDPTRLELDPAALSPSKVAALLAQAWSLFEPTKLNPFENLDMYLMRQTFEALHGVSYGSYPRMSSAAYSKMNQTLATDVLGPGRGDYIVEFLQRPYRQADPTIVKLASRDPNSKSSLEVKLTGMMGRTLILVRFALAALRDLMSRSGISASDIDFWIQDLLFQRAIALPTGAPVDYADLRHDINDNLVDIAPLETMISVEDLPDMVSGYGGQVAVLCGFERVAAWSVA